MDDQANTEIVKGGNVRLSNSWAAVPGATTDSPKLTSRFFAETTGGQLLNSTSGSVGDLQNHLSMAASWFCFFEDQELPTDRRRFEKRLQDRQVELLPIFHEVFASFETSLRLRHEIMALVERLGSPALTDTRMDLVSHVERLFPSSLLNPTGHLHRQRKTLAGARLLKTCQIPCARCLRICT